MNQPPSVRISREGKEIGTYSAPEAIRLLLDGTLKTTDFYWHEGMTDWAPLVQLQASEERRQSAERALLQKQEEAKRAEQLAQERAKAKEQEAKAKEEEDRAVAEATRIRMQKERARYFKCHCCRESFKEPRGWSDMIGSGIGALIFGFLLSAIALVSARSGEGFMLFLMSCSAAFATVCGVCMILASFIRSPHCPSCQSTNFSRPENTES